MNKTKQMFNKFMSQCYYNYMTSNLTLGYLKYSKYR